MRHRPGPLGGGLLTYSVDEAAAVLGVHPDTIRAMVKRGALARVPFVGRKFLIAKVEMDRFLSEATTPPAK